MAGLLENLNTLDVNIAARDWDQLLDLQALVEEVAIAFGMHPIFPDPAQALLSDIQNSHSEHFMGNVMISKTIICSVTRIDLSE